MMATRNGYIKKTRLDAFAHVRKNGLTAIDLRDGDELIEVKMTDNERQVYLVTKGGYSICFKETDVRPMGRTAMGVRGIRLREDDEVIAMQLDSMGEYLLIASENGIGKMTALTEFHRQKRGGMGMKCYRIVEKTGELVGAIAVERDNEILMVNSSGTVIRISCEDISVMGRITSGVKLINLKRGQYLTSIAKVREDIDEEEEGGAGTNEPQDETEE
jgi:DNA gyrase subunit A